MTKFCGYCGAPLEDDERFCPGCGRPVSQPSQLSQPSRPIQPQNTGTYPNPQRQAPKKKSNLLGVLLIVALVGVLGYGVAEYLKYTKAKKDKGQIATQTQQDDNQQSGNGETADSETLDDVDWSSFGRLTDEELEYLKEHPIVATPENSPGNPDFIEVTFTEEDYEQSRGYAALVSQDKPETDIPELGIHVNFKSWNLDHEDDTLIVVQMPDKMDENTGMILHTYNYSLTSGQNSFFTDVEITAPVQGDPDMFGGFVSYNEEKGKWEDVYCELSEDGKTYVAYLSHFSYKSALERIKAEAGAAVGLYYQNGQSIFVQKLEEMRPKYERSSHYLYPVMVSSTVDFDKFFSQEGKNKLAVVEKMVAEGGKIPEKSAIAAAFGWLGFNETAADWGSSVADVSSNAAGTYDLMKSVGQTVSQTTTVGYFGQALTLVGTAFYMLEIADYVAQNTKDNPGVWETLCAVIKGVIDKGWGSVGAVAGTAGLATAATTFANIPAAATIGTVCTVVGAAICVYSVSEGSAKYAYKKNNPMGTPTTPTEAAIHYYMQHYATSERGFAYTPTYTWLESLYNTPNAYEEIDSAGIYEHHPEKLLDCKWGNWAIAYDCLAKKYKTDPRKLYKAYGAMYDNFADAFWNESKEVQRECFRKACRKTVKIKMSYKMYHDHGLTSIETTTLDKKAEIFSYPDSSDYKCPREAIPEWKDVQQELIKQAYKLKEQERERDEKLPKDSRLSVRESSFRLSDAWDAMFREWDETDFDINVIESSKNNAEARKTYHDRSVKQLKANTRDVAQDYYDQQYRQGVLEVKRTLYEVVVPLLNARLTFYAKNLNDPEKPYDSIIIREGKLPVMGFDCRRAPLFYPGNSKEVNTAFHLDLVPNDKNDVLLETTVYHYLMFDCPEKAYVGLKDSRLDAKTNWKTVEIVEENSTWSSVREYLRLPRMLIADTRVPVEFKLDVQNDKSGDYKGDNVECDQLSNTDWFKSLENAVKNIYITTKVDGSFSATGVGRSSGSLKNLHLSGVREALVDTETRVTIEGTIDEEKGVGSFKMDAFIEDVSVTYVWDNGDRTHPESISKMHLVVHGKVLLNIKGNGTGYLLCVGPGTVTNVLGTERSVGTVNLGFISTRKMNVNIPSEVFNAVAPFGGLETVIPDLGSMENVTKCVIQHRPDPKRINRYEFDVDYKVGKTTKHCSLIITYDSRDGSPDQCITHPTGEDMMYFEPVRVKQSE